MIHKNNLSLIITQIFRCIAQMHSYYGKFPFETIFISFIYLRIWKRNYFIFIEKMAMTSFDVFPICTMVLSNSVQLVFDSVALLAFVLIYLLLYVWIFHKNFSFHPHVFTGLIINCQISPQKCKISPTSYFSFGRRRSSKMK